MKKETIYAIALGIILGLVIAFIVVLILRPTGQKKTIPSQTKISPKPNHVKKSFKSLEIIQPADRQIIDSKNITIKGKVEQGSMIIISSTAGEKILKNKDVNFQTEFPLVLGENIISVNAYIDKTQRVPQIKTLQVYYFQEE
jgi:hypothetical protein